MVKRCYSCKTEKEPALFYKNKSTMDGLHVACKECNDTYQRNRYRTDEVFRNKRKLKWRRWSYKHQYGITIEQYNEMLRLQQNQCAICHKEASKERQHLSVDHCHLTGKIRGLLCDRCNVSLGTLENVEFVKRANLYLGNYW